MDAEEFLQQIRIPSPCFARWEAMPGGDVVRSCAECGKEVYHLSAMPAEEARKLVVSRGGQLCARLGVDSGGRYIFADKMADGTGRYRFRLRTLMGLIGAIGAAMGLVRLIPLAEDNEALGAIDPTIGKRTNAAIGLPMPSPGNRSTGWSATSLRPEVHQQEPSEEGHGEL